MSSDFDKALREAQAQRDAAEQEMRNRDLEKQREQRLARSIAEPYLRQLAPQVRDKLRELKVPLEQKTVSSSGWFNTFKKVRRFWGLLEYRVYLTEDGYFVENPELPGPDGFEAMMSHVYLVSTRDSYYSGYIDPTGRYFSGAGIYVHDVSRSVITILSRQVSDDIRYTMIPFSDWIARCVINLDAEAKRQRNQRR